MALPRPLRLPRLAATLAPLLSVETLWRVQPSFLAIAIEFDNEALNFDRFVKTIKNVGTVFDAFACNARDDVTDQNASSVGGRSFDNLSRTRRR